MKVLLLAVFPNSAVTGWDPWPYLGICCGLILLVCLVGRLLRREAPRPQVGIGHQLDHRIRLETAGALEPELVH